MASKFQNRLVGTIVLVAVGVIVLPIIFDGDKKYNENQFASIPLVSKLGDEENIDSIPPLTQNMPSTPPEGAAEAMQTQNQSQEQSGTDILSGTVLSGNTVPSKNSVPPEIAPVTPPPAVIPKDLRNTGKTESPAQQKVENNSQNKSEPRSVTKPEAKPKPVEQAPQAVAYVVQLGALKNADSVNEIVAKLRLFGHQVYTSPASPIQGQLTRIYVGPNASKQKLESILSELKEISGLQGQVKGYKP
ncbi:protein dedD [Xenorhabdus mauleonii]|uniref:DedD protein n=1 Tax=Xenorhabdus mauleonii TaxID=351675 RepID=A0A1I3J8H5_9GAMM|nr:cell division protein DedD [Xenorhabdus mauleonii]PHM46130.1 protein dedD [Xenorhabdus mauleonii]SFI56483.1 DedD protein [Xenorhabdus mauleonii]